MLDIDLILNIDLSLSINHKSESNSSLRLAKFMALQNCLD